MGAVGGSVKWPSSRPTVALISPEMSNRYFLMGIHHPICLIDLNAAGCNVIGLGSIDTQETLIMTKVKVRFRAVFRYT